MPDKLDQFRSFVIQKNPNISRDQLSQLDNYISEERGKDLVSRGVLTLDQAINPKAVAIASGVLASGGQIPQSANLTASERKQQGQLQNVGSLIDQLQSSYDPIKSPLGLKAKAATMFGGDSIIGKLLPSLEELGLAPNISRFEADRALAVSPIARVLQQESGPLTESDIERAQAAIPNATDAPSRAQAKFQALLQAAQSARNQQNPQTTASSAINSNIGSTTGNNLDMNDPRVVEALNQGYSLEEIQSFLQGR